MAAGAVYICTEDVFPSKRLQQLIDQQHKLRADVPAEVIQKIRFGNNIFVERAADLVSSSTKNVSKTLDQYGFEAVFYC